MYSCMCALGQRCLGGICGPGDWTFFGTPLFWSYFVGDRSTRSSANTRHLISDSSKVRPDAADCSSALANLYVEEGGA
jgi:hypothetical protein